MAVTSIPKGSEGAAEKSIGQQSENFSAHAARDANLADPANKLSFAPDQEGSAHTCLKQNFGSPGITDGGKDLVAQVAPEAPPPQPTGMQAVPVSTTVGNDTLRPVADAA